MMNEGMANKLNKVEAVEAEAAGFSELISVVLVDGVDGCDCTSPRPSLTMRSTRVGYKELAAIQPIATSDRNI